MPDFDENSPDFVEFAVRMRLSLEVTLAALNGIVERTGKLATADGAAALRNAEADALTYVRELIEKVEEVPRARFCGDIFHAVDNLIGSVFEIGAQVREAQALGAERRKIQSDRGKRRAQNSKDEEALWHAQCDAIIAEYTGRNPHSSTDDVIDAIMSKRPMALGTRKRSTVATYVRSRLGRPPGRPKATKAAEKSPLKL